MEKSSSRIEFVDSLDVTYYNTIDRIVLPTLEVLRGAYFGGTIVRLVVKAPSPPSMQWQIDKLKIEITDFTGKSVVADLRKRIIRDNSLSIAAELIKEVKLLGAESAELNEYMLEVGRMLFKARGDSKMYKDLEKKFRIEMRLFQGVGLFVKAQEYIAPDFVRGSSLFKLPAAYHTMPGGFWGLIYFNKDEGIGRSSSYSNLRVMNEHAEKQSKSMFWEMVAKKIGRALRDVNEEEHLYKYGEIPQSRKLPNDRAYYRFTNENLRLDETIYYVFLMCNQNDYKGDVEREFVTKKENVRIIEDWNNLNVIPLAREVGELKKDVAEYEDLVNLEKEITAKVNAAEMGIYDLKIVERSKEFWPDEIKKNLRSLGEVLRIKERFIDEKRKEVMERLTKAKLETANLPRHVQNEPELVGKLVGGITIIDSASRATPGMVRRIERGRAISRVSSSIRNPFRDKSYDTKGKKPTARIQTFLPQLRNQNEKMSVIEPERMPTVIGEAQKVPLVQYEEQIMLMNRAAPPEEEEKKEVARVEERRPVTEEEEAKERSLDYEFLEELGSSLGGRRSVPEGARVDDDSVWVNAPEEILVGRLASETEEEYKFFQNMRNMSLNEYVPPKKFIQESISGRYLDLLNNVTLTREEAEESGRRIVPSPELFELQQKKGKLKVYEGLRRKVQRARRKAKIMEEDKLEPARSIDFSVLRRARNVLAAKRRLDNEEIEALYQDRKLQLEFAQQVMVERNIRVRGIMKHVFSAYAASFTLEDIKVGERTKDDNFFYDLVTLPPIDARKLNPFAQMNLRDALSNLVNLYGDKLQRENGTINVSFVVYVESRAYGIVKRVGAYEEQVTLAVDLDGKVSADECDKVVKAFLASKEEAEKGNFLGSGGVVLVIDNAKATTFNLRYIKIYKRGSEMMLKPQAFFSSLMRTHKKIRDMVKMRPILGGGLCVLETFLLARDGKRKFCGAAWREYVYNEFELLTPQQKCALAEGDVKAFLVLMNEECKINVALVNAHDGALFVPGIKPDFERDILLLYFNHVYLSTWKLTCKIRETGVNAEVVTVINKKQPKSCTYKLKFEKKGRKVYKEDEVEDELEERKMKKDVKTKHIHWALDYETYSFDETGLQKPYLLIVRRLDSDEPFVFWGSECTTDFIFDLLLPICGEKVANVFHHFWAYNGSGFDFHFILEKLQFFFPITLIGSVTSIKSIKVDNNVDFLDLACWYSVPYNKESNLKGLGALAKRCKTRHQKTKFDYAVRKNDLDNDEFRLKAIKYCDNDVLVLVDLIKMLVIDMFENFEYNDRKALRDNSMRYPHSCASLALTIFKECFLEESLTLESSKEGIYNMEYASYHGGLTLAFKSFAQNVKFYDINSSYPAIMLGDMPFKHVGSCRLNRMLTTQDVVDTNLYVIDEYHFKSDEPLPCFMQKSEKTQALVQVKNWKKTNTFTYVWGCEVRLALERKCVIHCVEMQRYVPKTIFKEYVETFYEKKKQAKLSGNVVAELFNKMLMNSLAGKLGEKNYAETSIGSMGVISPIIYERGMNEVDNITYSGDGRFKITWKKKKSPIEKIGGLCRFPAYIDAMGRILLIRAMFSVKNFNDVLYCDTDSIALRGGVELGKEFVHDTILGKFKHEKEKDSLFGFFFGSKNYTLIGLDDKIHVKCKGNRIVSPDVFLQAMKNNEEYTATVKPFFVKKDGKVYVTSITRTIRNTFDIKRKNLQDAKDCSFDNLDEYLQAYLLFESRKIARTVGTHIPSIDPRTKESIVSSLQRSIQSSTDFENSELTAVLEHNNMNADEIKRFMKLYKNEQINADSLVDLITTNYANTGKLGDIKEKIMESEDLCGVVNSLIRLSG